MKKPTRADFGWTKEMKWVEGFQDKYYEALKAWENQPKTTTAGRQRTRPIHPSWNDVLQNFDSNDSTRSQGAFCRWADLNRGIFSAMQCKPIPMYVAELVGAWNAQGKEVENG